MLELRRGLITETVSTLTQGPQLATGTPSRDRVFRISDMDFRVRPKAPDFSLFRKLSICKMTL